MQEVKKTQFDYINFVYGVGAAVILIAAMFKFLGWEYANEIFIVGLTTEAMIFLVSAFQWTSNESGYKWEKVFPSLTADVDNDVSKIDFTKSVQDYHKNTLTIVESVKKLDEAMKTIAKTSETLSVSAKSISDRMDRMEKTSSDYEKEFAEMKSRLGLVNEFYEGLSKVVEENDKKGKSK